MKNYKKIFNNHAIVRAMPNTPSSIAKGITGFVKNSLVNNKSNTRGNETFSGFRKSI